MKEYRTTQWAALKYLFLIIVCLIFIVTMINFYYSWEFTKHVALNKPGYAEELTSILDKIPFNQMNAYDVFDFIDKSDYSHSSVDLKAYKIHVMLLLFLFSFSAFMSIHCSVLRYKMSWRVGLYIALCGLIYLWALPLIWFSMLSSMGYQSLWGIAAVIAFSIIYLGVCSFFYAISDFSIHLSSFVNEYCKIIILMSAFSFILSFIIHSQSRVGTTWSYWSMVSIVNSAAFISIAASAKCFVLKHPDRCLYCGYSIGYLDSIARCPECGHAINNRNVKARLGL